MSIVSRLGITVATLSLGAAAVVATAPAPVVAPSPCPASVSPLLVPLAASFGGILVDPGCQYVYLTNTTQNRVEIYSLQTQTLETPIQVGAQPMGLDITPDGTLLYVANSGGNNISVLNLVQRVELRRITIPSVNNQFSPWAIAIANNGKALVSTSNNGSGGVRELDLATDQIASRADFPSSGITDRLQVKASQDRGTIAFAAGNISSGPVTLYRASTNTFSGVKRLSAFITDLSLDSTGSTVLVTPGSYVVDASGSMTGTIIGGSGGGGGAVDPTRSIGYRAVDSRIDILNLSTFLKVGELSLGHSVSSAGLSNSIGRMSLSSDGTLLAVITNTGFSIVRPLAEAPQRVNLVRNGSFGSGMTNWQTYATPDLSYVQSDVTSGVFRFNRLSPPPNSSNQAVVFQETGMALPAGAPIQARFDLGNSSSVRKRISVLLLESDFSDLHVCTFWVPPNAPLATYRMRSHTTKAGRTPRSTSMRPRMALTEDSTSSTTCRCSTTPHSRAMSPSVGIPRGLIHREGRTARIGW